MRTAVGVAALLALLSQSAVADGLFPRGRIHIPIGHPDHRDTLKTVVEAEGNFSPGFASYGVAFWIADPVAKRLFAPTQEDVAHEKGLTGPGVLIPWTSWQAGEIAVRSEVCQTPRTTPDGELQIVGARVRVTNTSSSDKSFTLYAAVSPNGPAGAPIRELTIRDGIIHVNGRIALVPETPPDAGEAPVPNEDSEIQPVRSVAPNPTINSRSGNADGALRYEVHLTAGETKTYRFLCPVLPGRRAASHLWDGTTAWAQTDDADPIIGSQGADQPSPDMGFYRSLSVDSLFADAETFWRTLRGGVQLDLPDAAWIEAFQTVPAHIAMCLNEGAPDVAVINYNTFTRDAVYMAHVLDESGNATLARQFIAYLLKHPFSGRAQPEGDNPGELLWLIGEHYLFTRDEAWLREVWPEARKLVAMIEYCRTAPEPHWVSVTGVDFGADVPDGDRMRLKPGACDGFHPEFTEAFDLAGIRAAGRLAQELSDAAVGEKCATLADSFAKSYDARFGPALREHSYADYAVLWPCRVYPLQSGRGFEAYREIGPQPPKSWRYFPLALAHQGLLAGNRSAGFETLSKHFALDSMKGWYAMDEGGPSAPGNWMKVISSWKVTPSGPKGVPSARAMPHGWALAEFHALLRDSLVFEETDRLVLFAGIPPAWFREHFAVRNLPTHFGTLSLEWQPGVDSVQCTISVLSAAPKEIVLRLPKGDQSFSDWAKPLTIQLP